MSDLGIAADRPKTLGFWRCWSLTTGIMIGSGIFLLPSVLAPIGMLSFWGWALTAAGSLCLALVIARLGARTIRSGGVYRYAHDAFGPLTGFLVGWGYWASYWMAMPAMAMAFAGYLGVLFPAVEDSGGLQVAAALALIWTVALINLKGISEAGAFQLAMTLLKLIPLAIIIALGFAAGTEANLPDFNPQERPLIPAIAATALLTMWAFSGLEAGATAAEDVRDPERTIPRAIVLGTLTVAFIYIAATYAVMLLVPTSVLAGSTAPFAEAAAMLGPAGPTLIAIGALIATAGAVHGVMFVTGQIPMAVAGDGHAPPVLTRLNRGSAPWVSLLLGTSLSTLLLLANQSRGLIGIFTLLAMMATLSILVPLLVCAVADWRAATGSKRRGAAAIALIAIAYSLFAIIGSGWEVLAWGTLLYALGLPFYLLGRRALPPGETAIS